MTHLLGQDVVLADAPQVQLVVGVIEEDRDGTLLRAVQVELGEVHQLVLLTQTLDLAQLVGSEDVGTSGKRPGIDELLHLISSFRKGAPLLTELYYFDYQNYGNFLLCSYLLQLNLFEHWHLDTADQLECFLVPDLSTADVDQHLLGLAQMFIAATRLERGIHRSPPLLQIAPGRTSVGPRIPDHLVGSKLIPVDHDKGRRDSPAHLKLVSRRKRCC